MNSQDSNNNKKYSYTKLTDKACSHARRMRFKLQLSIVRLSPMRTGEVKVEGVFLLADRTKHRETSCKRGVMLQKSLAALPQSSLK